MREAVLPDQTSSALSTSCDESVASARAHVAVRVLPLDDHGSTEDWLAADAIDDVPTIADDGFRLCRCALHVDEATEADQGFCQNPEALITNCCTMGFLRATTLRSRMPSLRIRSLTLTLK